MYASGRLQRAAGESGLNKGRVGRPSLEVARLSTTIIRQLTWLPCSSPGWADMKNEGQHTLYVSNLSEKVSSLGEYCAQSIDALSQSK